MVPHNASSIGDTSWNSPYSVIVQIIVWLVIIVLSLETIIGNAMVIAAYKLERNISKQVSNRYIVSLAFSDLIIGIEGFPLFTVYVLNGERWPLGSIACETWLFLDYTLCLVSILTVLLITADRYLSVCHTAKYLKWQSPSKTQMCIILSWLIPAIIFGIMIYGWKAMTGGSSSMNGNAECSAPFLSNPYVNMGMYVAYYWTTLIAMLILYKGIHQAAKNLEKKAKAKERRHIALILSQRLGTQVGVSLMLQSRAEKKEEAERLHQLQKEQRDSGYQTTTTTQAGSGNTESEPNLCVIEEERSFALRRESNESNFVPGPYPTAANSRRESEMERVSLLSHQERDEAGGPEINRGTKNRLSIRSNHSRRSITSNHSLKGHNNEEDKNDSLKRMFSDDELNSVLNFNDKDSLKRIDSSNVSDGASVIMRTRSSRRYRKKSKRDKSFKSPHGTPRRIAQKPLESVPAIAVEANNPGPPDRGEIRRSDRWVMSVKRRIARALERGKSTRREQSSSSDSSSSSDTEHFKRSTRSSIRPGNRLTVPQLTVTQQQNDNLTLPNGDNAQQQKTDTLLTAQGHRKVSSISTSMTRERIITSIFAPINIFTRGRKQTRAEKRAHKAFRTITFIVGFFAILWSPYYIMATVYGFCKGECIPSAIYTLSYYMCYLNSSGNPFAYALANRQFRSAFARMLRGNFQKIQ
ncbi:hypothetical protein WR25_09196 isoform A [Diploscapter pachys]|uniref:G-protein coupled receptors family 1 profile domain-containing protein n=1 Tax=Diploscapter pachys TaxID=2018661 RepID=A0A2A2LZ31_9BILA|nr:hypothetical protein WR25_09196 isoform A [Diploscapter pachys]